VPRPRSLKTLRAASQRPHGVPLRSPEELQTVLAPFLVRDPGHERWLALWTGTLRLLEQQEPRAYRRVLAKLARHGLAGVAPTFGGVNRALTADEQVVTSAGLVSPNPHDDLLPRVQQYAADTRPVPPLRTLRRRPRRLLVVAYYGALWKLTQAPPRLTRRGESLEDRAVDLVAERFGLSPAATHATIKHAHAQWPAGMTWIRQTPGAMLWALTMAPGVARPPRAR
jgi:hypothetical protein